MSSSVYTEDIQSQSDKKDLNDVFNILVATDIHLGYAEKDPIKGGDTFTTFEEILKIAQEQEVDFLLLGGDLFHETRPSAYCIYKCTELLKKYCLGDRPIQIEYLSDPSRNFAHTGNVTVNYEDPNLNIGLPVFSIHGNHDDPTGEHQISAMNLMASTGLVNYFGKWDNYTHVQVEPILLQKGETKLALYGLSHIKDERLGRLFLDEKVTFLAPPEPDKWFHVLVWHQNRANRGVKNFIPDHTLPDLLDLVIWGHEHDCRIDPELRQQRSAEPTEAENIYIIQPGSSVATSLSHGESIPKHVGLLKIYQKQFSLTKIPLRTVRPFIYRDMVLKEVADAERDVTPSENAMQVVEREINDMIQAANNLGRVENMLPLIRLHVDYRDEKQVFNTIRFGQKYIGEVANPEDMLKMKAYRKVKSKKDTMEDINVDMENGLPEHAQRVEDLVKMHFEDENSVQLKCLSVKALNEAVIKYIDSNDVDAPAFITQHLIEDTRKQLEDAFPPKDDVEEFVLNIKQTREQNQNYEAVIQGILNDGKRANVQRIVDTDSDDDDVAMVSGSKAQTPKPTRGPGSRGGRGSRGTRGTTSRGRGAKKGSPSSDVITVDSDEDIISPPRGKGSRGGRGSRGRRGSKK